MKDSQFVMVAKDRAILVKDNKACLVEFDMKIIEQYDWTVTQNGSVITEKDGKYGFVKNGNEIVPTIYDEVREEGGGRIKVRTGDKWTYGLVDAIGRELCEPKYEKLYDFKDGLAQVKLNGKWGLIDQCGNEVCTPQYDDIKPFDRNYFEVSL